MLGYLTSKTCVQKQWSECSFKVDSVPSFRFSFVSELQSTLGQDFAAKVYLRVETPDGKAYTIVPDGLERSGNSFIINDAKFSRTKDLLNLPVKQLRTTFTTNQKAAFDAIAAGEARVTLLNSQGGRSLLRDEFRMGEPYSTDNKIYVNTPHGIVLRTWP